MADGGVSFFQAQIPERFEPEKPKREPTEVELLKIKLSEMEENSKKSSAEAHRKISELTTSTSFLNQTIQDLMSRNMATQQSTTPETPAAATDWDAAWKHQFGGTPTAPSTKEGDDVDPEEIAQTVRQEFGKLYQEGEQAKVAYQQQEAALIEKFRNEEKDLHVYAEEVKELWRSISMANPQLDLPSRYALVVDTAKRTLLKNGKAPSAPSNQGGNGGYQHPSRQQRGEGLQGTAYTGNFGEDVRSEQERENQRRKNMAQSLGYRKNLQAQRMGLGVTPQ